MTDTPETTTDLEPHKPGSNEPGTGQIRMLRLYRIPLVVALGLVAFEAGRIPYGYFTNQAGKADAKTVALADDGAPKGDPDAEVPPIENGAEDVPKIAPAENATQHADLVDPKVQTPGEPDSAPADPAQAEGSEPRPEPMDTEAIAPNEPDAVETTGQTNPEVDPDPSVDENPAFDPKLVKRDWQQLAGTLGQLKNSMAERLSSAAETVQVAARQFSEEVTRRADRQDEEGPEIAPLIQVEPDALVITNPKATGAVIHYLVDGEVRSLQPGDSDRLQSGRTYVIMFDRGGDYGSAKHELAEGSYAFGVTSDGWALLEVTAAEVDAGAARD